MAVDDLRSGTWVTYIGGRATSARLRRCRIEVTSGPDAGLVRDIEAKETIGDVTRAGGVIGTPFSPINGTLNDEQIQRQYLPRALLYLAMFLLTQWLFLCPRGSWKIRRSDGGPPPLRAAVAAGFIGMLLAIGLLASMMEILDVLIEKNKDEHVAELT